MDIEKRKEELSIAYISAICAMAGIDYDIIRHDGDSTDGQMKKVIVLEDGLKCNAQLRVQLKSTSSGSMYSKRNGVLKYKLRAKNYNDLCGRATTPIVLMLLILPEDEKEWLKWSSEELILRGLVLWLSLSGLEPTSNAESVTVEIPFENVVNSETAVQMLECVAKEEWA